jgi:hypothetical protein
MEGLRFRPKVDEFLHKSAFQVSQAVTASRSELNLKARRTIACQSKRVDETKAALQELGFSDRVEME